MKITSKFKLLFMSIAGIILSLSLTNVNAQDIVPTKVQMKGKGDLFYYTERNRTDYINGYNFYRKELVDGTLAYCSSNITSNVPAGQYLSVKGEVTDLGLVYIITNGYPYKSFTGDDKKDYYITQSAIWRYFDETRGSRNWSSYTFTASSTGMKADVYNLVQGAKAARNGNGKAVSVVNATISDKTMVLKSDEFVSKAIKVNLTNTTGTYKVTLEDAPKGTVVRDTNGNAKKTFKSGEKFVIATLVSNIKGSIKVKITATGVTKKLYEYTTMNAYYQDIITTKEYTIETGNVSTSLKLNFKLDTKIQISKQDKATKKALAGATLVLKDSNGKVVDEWVSTKKVHTINNLLPGTYTLTEKSAPSGYKLNKETIKIKVKGNNTSVDAVMYNEHEVTKLKVSKQDITTKKELSGATLILKDSKGKQVDKWVSTNKVHYIEGLDEGEYTLTEKIAPEGYELSTETIKFTLKADGKVKTVTMYNSQKVTTKLKISKQDITTKKELPGATLILKDSKGKQIDKWVSGDEPHYIEGLDEGEYTLTEKIAPEGYELSTETIKFTLKADGKVKTVTMYNSQKVITKLKVSKQDITSKKELKGATLVIKDSKGNVVASWVSSDEAHYIEGLEPGSYTLTETIAPNGYKLSSEKIKFTLKADGKVKTVVMYNEKEVTKLKVSKQDITNGKELKGATLVIKDINGKQIDKWVSGDEPHYIEGLKAGTYTLTEEVAPNGYKLSSETIKFTLKADGTVKTVVMYNEHEVTKLKVSKQDITNGKELPGATLVIKDINGKQIDKWVSGDEPHYIEGLKAGTYTLTEEVAPNGYKLSSETIKFTLKADGTVKTVVMYNEHEVTKLKVSKQDITNGKELPGATLVIKDINGNQIDSWISGNEPHYIEGLKEGNYTLTETIAPEGYELSTETIKFTLKADGKVETVVMYNALKTVVTKLKVSKQDIANKEELPGATLVIKDSNGNTVANWVSGTTPHYIEGLEPGNYTLTEEIAPNGYRLSSETIKFTVKSDGSLTSVVMYNTKKVVKLSVSKQDLDTKTELSGASLVIRNSNGEIVDRWISSLTPHYTEELPEGEYTLTEEVAPNGYKLSSETIKFTLKDSDKVTSVVMYNQKKNVTKVRISKQDITNKSEFPGAMLIIRDKDNQEVDRWISTSEPHYIEGLSVGEYTLTELLAPNGYVLSSETIKFVVKDDGSVTEVVMYNELEKGVTKVKISKQDITSKEEIAGATLIIKDKDGNEIEKWVSGTKPYYIEGLDPGKYTLTELIAPEGYQLSSETIEFEVKDDGSITSVVMYNARLIEIPITDLNLTMSSVIIGSIVMLLGASLLIYYKRIYM